MNFQATSLIAFIASLFMLITVCSRLCTHMNQHRQPGYVAHTSTLLAYLRSVHTKHCKHY